MRKLERNIGTGPHCTTTVGGDLVYFITCVEILLMMPWQFNNDSQVTK